MASTGKMNVIAVDSETGSYWYGARRLQTRAEIEAFIRQQSKREKVPRRNRLRTLREFLRRSPLKPLRNGSQIA